MPKSSNALTLLVPVFAASVVGGVSHGAVAARWLEVGLCPLFTVLVIVFSSAGNAACCAVTVLVDVPQLLAVITLYNILA